MISEVQISDYPRAPEIAAALGVTQKTVWGWAKRGIIRRYRLGRSTYFCWADIQEALAENCYIGDCRRPAPSYRGGRACSCKNRGGRHE